MAKRPPKPKCPALRTFPAGTAWELTILGPPRTKKTHQRIAKRADGSRFIMSAAVTLDWAESAIAQLRAHWHRPGGIDQPVTVRALIYRDKAQGDACGFYQAIGDALQNAWVLTDDKWIDDWDGSRRLKDAANPRVVVTVTTL
jgi:hypothetical protein